MSRERVTPPQPLGKANGAMRNMDSGRPACDPHGMSRAIGHQFLADRWPCIGVNQRRYRER
jgi:hypothetical protein